MAARNPLVLRWEWYGCIAHQTIPWQALHLGPFFAVVANGGGDRPWLVTPANRPLSTSDLARIGRLDEEGVERALTDLERGGILVRRADGALGFSATAWAIWTPAVQEAPPGLAKSRKKDPRTDPALNPEAEFRDDQKTWLKACVDAWNSGVLNSGVQRAAPVGPGTRTRDLALLRAQKEHPLPEAGGALGAALACAKFYRGENDRGWKASLAWILERGNGAKLDEWMERSRTPQRSATEENDPAQVAREDAWEAAAAEFTLALEGSGRR